MDAFPVAMMATRYLRLSTDPTLLRRAGSQLRPVFGHINQATMQSVCLPSLDVSLKTDSAQYVARNPQGGFSAISG